VSHKLTNNLPRSKRSLNFIIVIDAPSSLYIVSTVIELTYIIVIDAIYQVMNLGMLNYVAFNYCGPT
jgi:hypothetical protein